MNTSAVDELPLQGTFCPENPAITVCQSLRDKNRDSWKTVNLCRRLYLAPLNDEVLRQAIYAGENGPVSTFYCRTDYYAFSFRFGESDSLNGTKLVQVLFPAPTVLPSFQVILD
ncbi:hypothetical protein Peur_053231 [Populus x canadensis]|jgi:gamma-tubulin complex component 5